ncbi:hypothetical protein PFNF135_05673 [Plasmodium falciparum NF135/5.C10]|uniref:Uncharacterized protein n=1 Tax=Plasmodium falciparum NF135/5.C10 TaxID=1036726 RepID=W4I9E0_PLAFA|nr:hypothetical protein PFNF135_05673 [Plasmodium falciparum NF135/5.C10]
MFYIYFNNILSKLFHDFYYISKYKRIMCTNYYLHINIIVLKNYKPKKNKSINIVLYFYLFILFSYNIPLIFTFSMLLYKYNNSCN